MQRGQADITRAKKKKDEAKASTATTFSSFIPLRFFQQTMNAGLITKLSTNMLSFISCPCTETKKAAEGQKLSRIFALSFICQYNKFIIWMYEKLHAKIIPYGKRI